MSKTILRLAPNETTPFDGLRFAVFGDDPLKAAHEPGSLDALYSREPIDTSDLAPSVIVLEHSLGTLGSAYRSLIR
jgi:hypothetical protein